MRKVICILACLLVLAGAAVAAAEGGTLTIAAPSETIRPGKAFVLSYTVPEDGLCELYLVDMAGERVMDVVTGHPSFAGQNQLWWNGTSGGQAVPEGVYRLVLETAQGRTECAVVMGPFAPYMTSIAAQKDVQAHVMTVDFYASVDGLLTVGQWNGTVWSMLENRRITAGMNQVIWDAADMQANTTALTLTLTDESGYSSNEEHVAVCPEDFGMSFVTPEPTPTAAPDFYIPQITPGLTVTAEIAATPQSSATPDPFASLDLDALESPEPAATPTATPTPEPESYTPSYGSAYPLTEADAGTYWGTPMDVTDTEAMWKMLSAPFTYVDASYKGQTKVYAEPDDESRAVAVITGKSQGVRVIENRDDGWTLIELYSSTFHDNSIQAWNMLVQGYVRTSKLKTKEMDDKYHIIVDKLTQRLYLFGEGELITTLLVSTGLSNERQPYNETRSGEFLYISATGGFKSDNMVCPMGMKFNDGDLLHEVPYVQRYEGGSKIYSTTEPYLGTRASHGCIRVQRKRTPEGINMEWIWDHRKDLGRIVVWEDWQGRQVPYPDADMLLYYNPNGGSYYHRAEKCYSASDDITFVSFSYGELDTGDFAQLEFCPYCAPALRRAEIDKINEEHALGGDHDPILTEARQKYLDKIVDKHGLEALTEGELRYYRPDGE